MTDFTMLVGLPCSGKSTWVKEISENFPDVIIESDEYRLRLFENKQDKETNAKLFSLIHNDIYELLSSGKNVILDATNLSYKHRKELLDKIKKLNVNKTCILFATQYELCLERNEDRERQVPEETIRHMRESFQCPLYSEGFDDIEIIYNYNPEDYIVSDYLNEAEEFNQQNPNHSMTLGHHSTAVAEEVLSIVGDNDPIYLAALLHDNGKRFSKVFTNMKGELSTIAHYYFHENISAYESLFYLNNELTKNRDILFACGVVNYHMRLHTAKTDKAKKKLLDTVGSQMYNFLEILNLADIKAH